MQEKLRQFYHQQLLLIKGSFFAFTGGVVANFLTYLFQLIVGRLLNPSDYGTLISLRSLMVYGGVLSPALQTALTKKTSELAGEEKRQQLTTLFWTALKFLTLIALTLIAIFFILTSPLTSFLRVDNSKLVFSTALVVGISYLLVVPAGFLCGLWRFKALSLLGVVNAGMLLILSVAAIYLGFGLSGVIIAQFFALAIGLGLGIFLLKKNISAKGFGREKNNFIVEIAKFTGPAFLITISLTAFYNSDILLVKHFFNAEQAGIYSSASIIGRIIFFGTSTVTGVMFPIISGKKAAGKEINSTFWASLGLTLLGVIGVAGLFLLFPSQVVRILFGAKYATAVPLLRYFTPFMGLYSLLNLLANFFLAIKKFHIAPILLIGALTQVSAIWFWHKNLAQVAYISALIVGILLIFAFGLYFQSCFKHRFLA